MTPAVAVAGRAPASYGSWRVDSIAALGDPDLARRIQAAPGGTAPAEEAVLCERFARRIRLFGLRHLRDEHLAMELVQRVLVTVLEKLRRGAIRDPERIASFVLGTARLAARELRREGARAAPIPDGFDAAGEDADGGEEPLLGDHLARCLEALAERERAVTLLTYYAEQDAAGIGAALGTTPGNVRVIRHRALERLRRCLGLGEEEP